MPPTIMSGAVVGALVGGLLSLGVGGAGAAQPEDPRAPVLGVERASAIDGRYVVVLEGRASKSQGADAVDQARENGASDVDRFTTAIEGFAAVLSDRAVEALRTNPHVAYIEADQRVSIDATQSPATWGLDRIDQRTLPLSNSYTYTPTGQGVTAYVIDTGVLGSHDEFAGRMAAGYSAINDGRGTTDCNGHGTHVAGTVGGATYGVAKQVTIRPVRVLDCAGSGSTSGVIAGVDWVTSNHTAGAPAVANLSLGGGVSSALDSAVSNSIADGVTYAVAAGNENTDACNGSPARVASALTVGSITNTDARSSFSNYGSCLDLFAPGSNITSAWSTSTTATHTISGTSMATPHVAGVAALYLQGAPSASPATVNDVLLGAATIGLVTGAQSGSPDRLLASSLGLDTTEPTAPPIEEPTAPPIEEPTAPPIEEPTAPPIEEPTAPPIEEPTAPPSANLLLNPGFESVRAGWRASRGVLTSDGRAARTGTRKALFNGRGRTTTHRLTQSVAVPAGSRATLSFWLSVRSVETATVARDRLRVEVVSDGTTTVLGRFSNLDRKKSYRLHVFDLSEFDGTTLTLRFTGTENDRRATSFVIDDTSLTTG